jgi:hypothetical protein
MDRATRLESLQLHPRLITLMSMYGERHCADPRLRVIAQLNWGKRSHHWITAGNLRNVRDEIVTVLCSCGEGGRHGSIDEVQLDSDDIALRGENWAKVNTYMSYNTSILMILEASFIHSLAREIRLTVAVGHPCSIRSNTTQDRKCLYEAGAQAEAEANSEAIPQRRGTESAQCKAQHRVSH